MNELGFLSPYNLNEKLIKTFTGGKLTELVQAGENKYIFGKKYEKEAENFYNFQVRKDDVWVLGFPRSGTTLTQEMTWLLANNLNYEKAAKTPLTNRFPFFENSLFVYEYPWNMLVESTERRFIKTNLPLSLLPPNLLETGCKVIYVARNPKDVAVSCYHFSRLLRAVGYVGGFPEYWDYFERNLLPWTPCWCHIQEAWEKRNEKNLRFLFYEDLNKDIRGGITKVADFLETALSKDDVDRLENHLKIANFRKDKSVNLDYFKSLGHFVQGEESFIREGKTGGWKEYFSSELNDRAEKWIRENLKNIDIECPPEWVDSNTTESE